MPAPRSLVLFFLLSGIVPFAATGADADTIEADLKPRFNDTVRPFLNSHCLTCHSGDSPMAQFDLSGYTSLATVVEDYSHWALVLDKLTTGQMPPPQAQQPSSEDRQNVIAWIEAVRQNEARKNAGDPGIVLARRLSNAEYNYTIFDLTGVDIQPTREFPVDPANLAGFDNSGESLAMSPALLDKYLQAAREVADHLVFKPGGLAFAPHPMLVETDRDKYCVSQIIDFYRSQNTDYSDYFQTAWRYKHRAVLGKPNATLADFAAEHAVSAKYLDTIWRTLEETREEIGPLAKLQSMWRELPIPRTNQPDDLARQGSSGMRDFVVQLRGKIELRHTDLRVEGIGRTAQPFLMWRNHLYATHRRDYDRAALQVEGEGTEQETSRKIEVPAGSETEEQALRQANDPDLHVPAGQQELYEAAFARFADLFPDHFYVSERGRYFPDNTRDVGRHLSAGFHNLMGYFRDDLPLYELILGEEQQQELDALWRELDYVARGTTRTYVQFYLFEADGVRRDSGEEDPGVAPAEEEITAEDRIKWLADLYLARARKSENPVAVTAIENHFGAISDTVRWVEQTRADAEPRHLEGFLEFAERAYRRPLTQAERDDFMRFYRSLREGGLEHEPAIRDLVVNVLMSPDFCYRVDLEARASDSSAAVSARAAPRSPNPGGSLQAASVMGRPAPAAPADTPLPVSIAQPLPDYGLASRLSYFLWSSMPDEELLAHAAADDLHEPEVVKAQALRMLKDRRVRRLATEFGGNWLDFRRFEEHNAVDRERFPSFNDELRQAMFEEPIELIDDVIRNDRSVLDFLYADYTFVNPVLAKHYGIPRAEGESSDWVRVAAAGDYGRGGLLPMSVFLTKNAPGLRTSPVKRGYWVVKRLLGEEIPPPPAAVPELPRDEAKMELSLRDALARHRADASCASCHVRFDSMGLALEGYGPIGDVRTQDLAGRPVDPRAEFPNGEEGEGLEGLQAYIRANREADFIDSLCRKMLVYALGRTLLLSDEPAIEAMRAEMAANDNRFSTLVESIVTSPQFLTKRAPDAPE